MNLTRTGTPRSTSTCRSVASGAVRHAGMNPSAVTVSAVPGAMSFSGKMPGAVCTSCSRNAGITGRDRQRVLGIVGDKDDPVPVGQIEVGLRFPVVLVDGDIHPSDSVRPGPRRGVLSCFNQVVTECDAGKRERQRIGRLKRDSLSHPSGLLHPAMRQPELEPGGTVPAGDIDANDTPAGVAPDEYSADRLRGNSNDG